MPTACCKCGAKLLTKARSCNPCSREYMRGRREKQIRDGVSKHTVYNYKWRELNPRAYLLSNARSSSKKRGLEFSISIEDIIIPEKCPVFGYTLELQWGVGTKNNKPSLDRIDSSKGYIKGNVQVLSWRANNLKSDSTSEEIKQLWEFMRDA